MLKITKRVLFFAILLSAINSFAQTTDTLKKITFSAYGELYYSYDFSQPRQHEKLNFIYNHKRHNEINANLLLARASYQHQRVRANMGIMAGNYAQYNLSAEPTWAQFVYEANMGFRLLSKANVWLDAGIMPSHIGFESAIGGDCWTLTRSLLAENSPYYETGAKLGYTDAQNKLYVALLVLNGWQRIRKPDDIQQASFGAQINYKPNSQLLLNYSNFWGTDKADSLKAFRFFHNFYVQYEPNQKWGIIAGFDIGNETLRGSSVGSVWFSPVCILRYTANNHLKIALRTEQYNDRKQVIVSTNTANGFVVNGVSANIDYLITPQIQWRTEAKLYMSETPIFDKKRQNYSLTSALILKL